MLKTALFMTAAAVMALPRISSAQQSWEFNISSGRMVATGSQRDAIENGNVSAAQIWFVPRSSLALTASVGWGRTRDITSTDAPRLNVFSYDVGAELRAPRLSHNALSFMPFAGAGAGGRSYDYRKLESKATHNAAAYAGAGAEFGMGRVRLRVEARDYVTSFKPLSGAGKSDTRNDVVVLAGLRFNAR